EEARKQGRERVDMNDLAVVRPKCIFTTHTPVPAGHDQFPLGVVSRVLGHQEDFSDSFASDVAARVFGRRQSGSAPKSFPDGQGMLNMTYLGLNMSRKSTRLNSSHLVISYAVFCLKKKKKIKTNIHR